MHKYLVLSHVYISDKVLSNKTFANYWNQQASFVSVTRSFLVTLQSPNKLPLEAMGKLRSSIELNMTDWASGDRHSYQQEDTDCIVYPPLVQASNGRISAPPGISKLPVELLSLIFAHCNSAIRYRLVLTHTCRRWRLIGVNYSQLWTNVFISTHYISSEERCERWESLLTLQVDRCGGLPLDITWGYDINDMYSPRVLRSIQAIAPFSRWRSLRLSATGLNLYIETLLASLVAFPNLESLVVLHGVGLGIVDISCRAVMPKLQMLDLRACNDQAWEKRLIKSVNKGTLSLPD
jgi:F-box-like